MNLQEITIKALPILQRNDVEFAGVFGSYARGEARETSDIDLLIRYSAPKGLDHIGLALELEEALGKKVDLVTEKYIYPPLKPHIARDLKILYGTRRYL